MSKKIFLLVFFLFLIIIPAGKVGATQYYVGVNIASAQAPGYPSGTTNTNWCLSKGTTLYIRNSSGTNLTAISPTINGADITFPACAGTTIWSALFDITSGTAYQIYIVPSEHVNNYYYSYCSGFFDTISGLCWVTLGVNKSCEQTCSYYGSTVYTATSQIYNYQPASLSCAIESFLMGGTCNSCTTNASYNFYDPSSYACYSSTNTWDMNGDVVLSGYARACPCSIQNNGSAINFTFPFTPSF